MHFKALTRCDHASTHAVRTRGAHTECSLGRAMYARLVRVSCVIEGERDGDIYLIERSRETEKARDREKETKRKGEEPRSRVTFEKEKERE